MKTRYCTPCGKLTHWFGARCLRCWKKAKVADLTPFQRLLYLALDKKGAVDLLLIALCFAALFLVVLCVVSWSQSSLRAALALGEKL
jgi:hypothetical protein